MFINLANIDGTDVLLMNRCYRNINKYQLLIVVQHPTRVYNRRSLSTSNVELGRTPYTERRSQQGVGVGIICNKNKNRREGRLGGNTLKNIA